LAQVLSNRHVGDGKTSNAGTRAAGLGTAVPEWASTAMTTQLTKLGSLIARTRVCFGGRQTRAVAVFGGLFVGGLVAVALLLSSNARGVSGRAADSPVGSVRAPAGAESTEPHRALNPPLFAQLKPGPEAQLVSVYEALAEGQFDKASELSQALVKKYPNFALGRLLQADLLATRAGQPAALGAPVNSPSASEPINPRRMEALRRLGALLDPPAKGLVPREFARLAPEVRTAVAVDASRSRLYIFRNGPGGLSLIADFYASVGQAGVSKHAEGDMRTPLGIYWITGALTANQIRPIFGAGAMGLNYPNAWDRSQGKSGRGVYVHGVPDETLAREPYSTDGCVALSNLDYLEVAAKITVLQTPVVIAESLDWVTPATAAEAARAIEPTLAARNASRSTRAANDELMWHDPNGTFENLKGYTLAPFKPTSVIGWFHDAAPLLVVTGVQAADDATRPPMAVRQYWTQREGQWRMVFEGAVPLAVKVESPPVLTRQQAQHRRS